MYSAEYHLPFPPQFRIQWPRQLTGPPQTPAKILFQRSKLGIPASGEPHHTDGNLHTTARTTTLPENPRASPRPRSHALRPSRTKTKTIHLQLSRHKIAPLIHSPKGPRIMDARIGWTNHFPPNHQRCRTSRGILHHKDTHCRRIRLCRRRVHAKSLPRQQIPPPANSRRR